jgi:DNA sulfur modification protein DndE
MSIAPPVETVRVDERARNHLVNLKRRTGIDNWNVLCRWALAISLREPSSVSAWEVGPLSNVEMTWLTFAGRHADLYTAVVTARCEADGLPIDDPDVVAEQFRLHLHRGISYLVGLNDTKTLEGLTRLALAD